MIIYGTKTVSKPVEPTTFYCPQCRQTTDGTIQQGKRYFTLYFIPLIPMGSDGPEYVHCRSCRGDFNSGVLELVPEADPEERTERLLRVMVMAALADGTVDSAERDSINDQYTQFSGHSIPPETLDQEIQMAQDANADLNMFVSSFASALAPEDKEEVAKTAYRTMVASGQLQPGHKRQLAGLARKLEIPDGRFIQLIEQQDGTGSGDQP